jgi:aminoglycoside 6'-N-acetyltransferase
MRIVFTPLTTEHLGLMHKWLNTPHVGQWWEKNGATREQVEKKYRARITGEEPARGFIITVDEEPIGYIQTYWLRDFQEYADQFKIDIAETTAAFDLFIGAENKTGKGLGPVVMTQFLREIVFGEMAATACTVGPEIENEPSIKAYIKVGFKHWTTAFIENSGTEYLMKIEPHDLASG